MASKRDYYEILGVSREASEAEIKKSYRRLARSHHPDANPGDHEAEERYQEITEAYEVLSNPEARYDYDIFGHQIPRGAGASGAGSSFGSFPGASGAPRGSSRGADTAARQEDEALHQNPLPGLRGDQVKLLRESIVRAYSRDELEELLLFELERDYSNVVSGEATYAEAVLQIIKTAQHQAWLPDFIKALHENRHNDENLRQLYEQVFGAVPSGETGVSAEPSAPHQADVPSSDTIFLSYSRKDWDAFVEPLVIDLRRRGFKVWIDQHVIRGGDNWYKAIQQALKTCERMVLCVSPASLESDYVQKEYRYFVRNRKWILPLICREADLPWDLEGTQYLPYRDRDSLVETLRGWQR